MNGFYFYLLIRQDQQDLQDYLKLIYFRFPDETGNTQSASRKINTTIKVLNLFTFNYSKASLISAMLLPKFRRQADAIFTVSSGNREKILLILLILSEIFPLR